VRGLLALSLLLAPLALADCGNTYHPEYHPVTVTHYEQHLAYPVTVQTGTRPAPVVVAPAPVRPPARAWPAWPTE
jgi:hypothetical protein